MIYSTLIGWKQSTNLIQYDFIAESFDKILMENDYSIHYIYRFSSVLMRKVRVHIQCAQDSRTMLVFCAFRRKYCVATTSLAKNRIR